MNAPAKTLLKEVDVLVIGAGPSGTVAAAMAKKGGASVQIVEKEEFPRFVIGESLLPRCMEALKDAGFLEAVEAHGFQKKFGAKFQRGGDLCDFNFSEGIHEGWSWTWQVQRAEFDQILAREAEKSGIPVHFKTAVEKIEFNGTDSVTTVRTSSGEVEEIRARFIIDSSGYGRVIPRLFKLDRPSNLPPRKAVFAHVKDERRANYDEPNRITIVSHEKGVWVWIIPFSNGVTSVGFVGDPSFFERNPEGSLEDRYRGLLESEPNTRERFRDIELVLEPRVLEGWSVTTDRFFGEGFVLTGNVTEFLDPIFSSGVTLATVSGHRAGTLAARQIKGEPIDWQKEFVVPTQVGVDTFRAYVMAWYDGSLEEIFYAENPEPLLKSQICSVLAGYVWDQGNPFVRRPDRALRALIGRIRSEAV